jgi:hypothetical protein
VPLWTAPEPGSTLLSAVGGAGRCRVSGVHPGGSFPREHRADGRKHERCFRAPADGAVDRLERTVVAGGAPDASATGRPGGAEAQIEVTGAQLDRKAGGEGGIRTPGTGISPYNRLAICPVQPLQHLSAFPVQ